MSYLLDTSVISEIRKPRADARVMAWFDGIEGGELFLSVLVVGEIRQGIERLRGRDKERAGQLDAWLDELKEVFRNRVLAVSHEVAEEWGRLNAIRSLPVIDGLLAATASVHGLTLVTRNVSDLRGTGVALLDPFGPPR